MGCLVRYRPSDEKQVGCRGPSVQVRVEACSCAATMIAPAGNKNTALTAVDLSVTQGRGELEGAQYAQKNTVTLCSTTVPHTLGDSRFLD